MRDDVLTYLLLVVDGLRKHQGQGLTSLVRDPLKPSFQPRVTYITLPFNRCAITVAIVPSCHSVHTVAVAVTMLVPRDDGNVFTLEITKTCTVG